MKSDYWDGKRVLVTGGAGFLGKHLIPMIDSLGADVFIPRSKDYDLRNEEGVERLFHEFRPELVIHMAVHGGGIGYMKEHPGSVFYDNIMMNSLIIEKSRQHDVQKFIGVGTVCSYPKFTPVPFREESLWDGYPEETNAPYGLAKKMMMVQTQAYREQYGFNGVHLLMVNMYGPHDDFDLESSHVIPALIRKFDTAVKNDISEVVVWGTGSASREFIYVSDAAEAIILATENYNRPEPVNIGVGIEIKIKDLVELVAELCGYEGDIRWDHSKPDGQPTRLLNVDKAENEFGFRAKTNLLEGLLKTIDWYRKQLISVN